jgi:hypothetical protein
MSLRRLLQTPDPSDKIAIVIKIFTDLLRTQHCLLKEKFSLQFLNYDEANAEIRRVINGGPAQYSGNHTAQIKNHNIELSDLDALPEGILVQFRAYVENRDHDETTPLEANERRLFIDTVIDKFNRTCPDAEKIADSQSTTELPLAQLTDYLEAISQDMRQEMLSFGQTAQTAKHVALENLQDKGVKLAPKLIEAILTEPYLRALTEEQRLLNNPRSTLPPVLIPGSTSSEGGSSQFFSLPIPNSAIAYILWGFAVAGVCLTGYLVSRQTNLVMACKNKVKNMFSFWRQESDLLPPDEEALLDNAKKFTPTNEEFLRQEASAQALRIDVHTPSPR